MKILYLTKNADSIKDAILLTLGIFFVFATFYTAVKASQRIPLFVSGELGLSGALGLILILCIIGTQLIIAYGCLSKQLWVRYAFLFHSIAIILSAVAVLPWYGLGELSATTFKNGLPYYLITILLFLFTETNTKNLKWPIILYAILLFIIISLQVLLRLG